MMALEVDQHIRIFDRIAPVYALFFKIQVRNFRRVLDTHPVCLEVKPCSILDIGCGTGALACVLGERGNEVLGLDGSARMIEIARRLNRHPNVRFAVGNALDPLEGRHDIVVASHVLHGLPKSERFRLYQAMRNLATKRVIIMDYNHKRSLLTSAIEWLEHGDYFNFIQTAEHEMREVFKTVRVVQTGKQAAWYICECG